MPSDDRVPFEPDLSLPQGSLDAATWDRILSDAFNMAEVDVDASLVPEYDGTETGLDEDDVGAAVFNDALLNDEELDTAETHNDTETTLTFDETISTDEGMDEEETTVDDSVSFTDFSFNPDDDPLSDFPLDI